MTIRVLIALLVFLITLPAHADLLFYDDCEDTYSSSDWNTNGFGGSNAFAVSSEQAKSGSNSYKFTLAPYGTSGTTTNIELVLLAVKNETGNSNFKYNTEYWLGYSVYIPSGMDITPGSFSLTSQFHGAYDPNCGASQMVSPNIAFFHDVSNSAFKVTIKGESDACDPTPDRNANYDYTDDADLIYNTNAWNDVVINFKFSYTSGYFFKIWVNGALAVDDAGMNCYNDPKGPYWKMGIYGHLDQAFSVYYDEVRVGDANSSYGEVAPQGGSPDTDPPILSGGTPTGTLASGTTSTPFGNDSSENATCRQSSNIAHAWADMAEMGTTGGTTHSETATGLSDGNTYYRYVICQDAATNESDKFTISWSVDSAGGLTNLISSSTIANYVGDKPEAIYDGCTDDYGPCLPEDEDNDLIFEIRLPDSYNNLTRRFFGDAVGSRVSKTLTLDWKSNDGDLWTNFETDTNVYTTAWYESDLTGITARYIRVTVASDTGYTQFREMELFGTLAPAPTAGRSSATYGGASAVQGSYAAGGVAVSP